LWNLPFEERFMDFIYKKFHNFRVIHAFGALYVFEFFMCVVMDGYVDLFHSKIPAERLSDKKNAPLLKNIIMIIPPTFMKPARATSRSPLFH
jgi:hypothetical protein